MARAQLTNNASTTLAAGINNAVTSMSVASGTGALFPAPGANYFYCTLAEGALIEIVKVTARTTDTFTIVRAQDGTTAQAFTAAALVRLNLTAAAIAELQDMASKDASGGYAGLTLLKLNLRNAADTFTSWLINTATAARTWAMQDRDGTVALTDDITGGTRAGSFTTLTATNAAQGDPVTTGSTQTYGTFRMRSGNGVLDGGVNGTVVWLQATDANALGSLYTLKINPNGGNVLFGGGGFGYGTGAWGTVTQATSKSTGVTLNKPCGQITMHAESMTNGAFATFVLANSLITATDTVAVSVVSPVTSYGYRTVVIGLAAGLCTITVQNNTGGTATDAVVINFAVIKGATS